jgi:hypothetical protein
MFLPTTAPAFSFWPSLSRHPFPIAIVSENNTSGVEAENPQ